jgi:NarL family two-component system response regulator LiaR
VIALTSFHEGELVQKALDAGAISYLLKDISASELATAIRAAHAGKSVLAREATRALIQRRQHASSPGADLTARELEVLALLAEGLSNPQIAERLIISRPTVSFHVSNILAKLDAANRAEAVALAYKQGLIKD